MSTTSDQRTPGHESGAALMTYGPEVLHDYMASRFEAAMGRTMPQMEVRFNNLSIAADVMVVEEDDSKAELPTVWNTAKKGLSKFSTKTHVVRKEILRNASGVLKPGTITLLLGQPGSGKSSFMKVLSGRFPLEKNVAIEGDVTYNGVAQADIMR
ncbi:ABC transporter, partial [Phytophthora megakarya]